MQGMKCVNSLRVCSNPYPLWVSHWIKNVDVPLELFKIPVQCGDSQVLGNLVFFMNKSLLLPGNWDFKFVVKSILFFYDPSKSDV